MSEWLVIAAGEDRQHGGNDGYEDAPSSYYSWDDSVPNGRHVREGDHVVLWDKKKLLGVGTVQRITETPNQPVRKYACPFCGGRPKARTTMTPVWKCQVPKCGKEFDERKSWVEDLTIVRAHYQGSWVDMGNLLTGSELRNVQLNRGDQLAIRRIRWDAFLDAVESKKPGIKTTFDTRPEAPLPAGHRAAVVRVRVGQTKFRDRLLDKYGAVCAFSGPAPEDALEAAHLYSYATNPEHDYDGGGFLLRRDLHRLFDRGHIAIGPDGTIEISSYLETFPAYAALASKPLQIAIGKQHQAWIEQHHSTVWVGRA